MGVGSGSLVKCNSISLLDGSDVFNKDIIALAVVKFGTKVPCFGEMVSPKGVFLEFYVDRTWYLVVQ